MLEAHYKVYFEQSSDAANSFRITDFIVDVVYGDITLEKETKHTFNLKTSVTYL